MYMCYDDIVSYTVNHEIHAYLCESSNNARIKSHEIFPLLTNNTTLSIANSHEINCTPFQEGFFTKNRMNLIQPAYHDLWYVVFPVSDIRTGFSS